MAFLTISFQFIFVFFFNDFFSSIFCLFFCFCFNLYSTISEWVSEWVSEVTCLVCFSLQLKALDFISIYFFLTFFLPLVFSGLGVFSGFIYLFVAHFCVCAYQPFAIKINTRYNLKSFFNKNAILCLYFVVVVFFRFFRFVSF